MSNGMLTRFFDLLRRGYLGVSASAHRLRAFAKAASGNVAVEYALCVGGVGALGVGGYSAIGAELAQTFEQVGRHICLTTRIVCFG